MKIIKSAHDVYEERIKALEKHFAKLEFKMTCHGCDAIFLIFLADLKLFEDPRYRSADFVGVLCPCCKRELKIGARVDLDYLIRSKHWGKLCKS